MTRRRHPRHDEADATGGAQVKVGAFWSLMAGHRDMRRLWLGETAAAFGTFFFDIAVMWYVFVRTGSGLDTGIVAVAAFLPMVALGPWFGALADRTHRRRLMVWSNVGSAALAAALTITVGLGAQAIWPVYVVTALLGAAAALYDPARAGIFPEIVPPEELMAANALFHTSRQVARVVGSTVGGVVIAVAGAAATMSADVLAFGAAAALVAGVHYAYPSVPADDSGRGPGRTRMTEDLGEAWRWIRQRPVLLVMSAIGMVSNIALGPANVLAPMLIRQSFHATAAALGIFDAAIGAGIIAGGVVIGMLTLDRLGLSLTVALAVEGMGLALVALSPAPWTADLGNLLLGIGLVTANAPGATMMQTLVPAGLRGRVNSLVGMMSALAIPITYGAVGVVGDAIGAHASYGLAAVLMAGCVLAALAVKDIRAFRLSAHAAPVAAPAAAHGVDVP